MKKFLIFMMLAFLSAVSCYSQMTIEYKDTATLTWSEVVSDANNVPLVSTDVVTYDVFMYDSALAIDDQVELNIDFLGNTVTNEFLLDFTNIARAFYWVGVRSVVTREDSTVVNSNIAWSYDEVATDNAPFGYVRLTGILVVPAPGSLRDSGM